MKIENHVPDDPREKLKCLLARLEDTREKMEIETQTFIEATKQFTLEWTRREMELAIFSLESEFSSNKLESDNEKLSKLKSGLKELPFQVPDIVESHLNPENFWIHRKTQLQAGISRDYIEFKKDKPEEKGWVKERGKRKYVCFLRFSDEMTASLNRYFERLEEFFVLNHEIKEEGQR